MLKIVILSFSSVMFDKCFYLHMFNHKHFYFFIVHTHSDHMLGCFLLTSLDAWLGLWWFLSYVREKIIKQHGVWYLYKWTERSPFIGGSESTCLAYTKVKVISCHAAVKFVLRVWLVPLGHGSETAALENHLVV